MRPLKAYAFAKLIGAAIGIGAFFAILMFVFLVWQ